MHKLTVSYTIPTNGLYAFDELARQTAGLEALEISFGSLMFTWWLIEYKFPTLELMLAAKDRFQALTCFEVTYSTFS